MFVTAAYAQDTATAAAGPGSTLVQFAPLVFIFIIMYFLMIRPQQKKLAAHKAMMAAVRRGDQVVTGGGIVGKVTKVADDNMVEVEIADGVKVKVIKSTLSQVLSKTDPAPAVQG
jgi:preprotein translocase subunit YajC